MKNVNAKFASTKFTTISDAEMASVLANSNWAKMEREAKNVAATAVQKSAHCYQNRDRCIRRSKG